MTGLQIITAALQEIGVLGAVDAASAEDAAFALGKLNRLVDRWNATRAAVYADRVDPGVLVAAFPNTIGPAGHVVVAQRPVSLEAILVYDGTTRVPLARHTERAWLDTISDPTLTGRPSDFYYDPTWPEGSIYLYPVPAGGEVVELWSRVQLTAFDLVTDVTLPPGYEDAYTLTLAEELAGPFKVPLDQLLVRNAQQARARIFANNDRTPRIATADAGMPGNGRGSWDYRTGS